MTLPRKAEKTAWEDQDTRGVSNALKLRILRRDGYRCAYCGVDGKNANLEIDHRIPHSKGGDNHISNLFTACVVCNRKKGAEVWDVHKGYKPSLGNRAMSTSVLDGLYLHILVDEKIRMQGQLLGIFQDKYLAVQLFSWIDGRETNVELYPIEKATDGTMIFYFDDIEMREAYYSEKQHEQSERERKDENIPPLKAEFLGPIEDEFYRFDDLT